MPFTFAHAAVTVAIVSSSVVAVCVSGPAQAATWTSVPTSSQVSAPVVSAVTPASGALDGNAAVTLHGSGFGRGAIVYFGSVRATHVRVASFLTITATTPPNVAGTVTIRVRVGTHLSAAASRARFTYVSPPTITSLSRHTAGTAGGPSVTISGRGFTAGSSVLFGTTPARHVSVASAGRIAVVAPAHAAGRTSVRVRTAYGTSTAAAASTFAFGDAPSVTSIGTVSSGQHVRVTGTNLTGTTGVRFGSAPAPSFRVVNATAIDAVAPDLGSATTTDVTVESPYGDSRPYEAGVYLPPPTYPVTTPTGFTATAKIREVDLSWSISGNHLQLERVSGSVPTTRFDDPSAYRLDVSESTSLTDLGVGPQQTYSYSLFAYDGTTVAAPATLTVTTHPLVTPPTVSPLRVLPYGPSAVAIDWQEAPNDDFAAVMIRRSSGSTPPATTADGTLVADNRPANGQYLDDGLTPGTTYSYSVFAYGYRSGTAPPGTATVRTSDSTHGFTAPTVSDPPRSPAGPISCPTATFCATGDTDGNVYTFDGSSWSRASSVSPRHAIVAVSCVSASFCIALDDESTALEYDGTSWTVGVQGLFSATASYPNDDQVVSCATTTFCLAIGYGEARESIVDASGVLTWEPVDDPLGDAVVALSCPVDGSCSAGTAEGRVLTFHSGAWTPAYSATRTSQYDNIGVSSVSCLGASFCLASEVDGYVLTFDGSTWTRSAAPIIVRDSDPSDVDGAVACSSTTSCVLAIEGRAAHFDGASWSQPVTYDARTTADNRLAGLACAPGADCRAVDGYAETFVYSNQSWSAAGPAGGYGGGPSEVSCVDASWCLAVDYAGESYVTDGTSWPRADPAPDGLHQVACVTRTFCVAGRTTGGQFTGYHGSVAMFDGHTWSDPIALDGSTILTGLSCTSVDACTAVSDIGYAYTYDGSSWSGPVRLPDSSVGEVSCAGGGFCVATGAGGTALLQRVDGVWSVGLSVALPSPDEYFRSVSCTSATFCMAVTTVGAYAVWDGTSWTRASLPVALPHSYQVSVSCWSSESCIALVGPYAQVWNGSSWTGYRVRYDVDTDDEYLPGAVSIVPGSDRAVATYSDGFAATYLGP